MTPATLQRQSGRRRQQDPCSAATAGWDLRLAGYEPGMAIEVSVPGARRLVVADTVRSERGDPVRRHEVIERSLWRDAAQVADALVGADGGRRLCGGVMVVDLMDQPADGTVGDPTGGTGRFDLHVRDSPPAILLRPGEGPRLLPHLAEGSASSLTVGSGDVLLVCSAAMLEQPPTVLATLRQRPRALQEGPTDVERVRQTLATAAFRGAVATVSWAAPEVIRRDAPGEAQVDVTVW
jgi:hypothetical protein